MNGERVAYFNGQIIPESEASISIHKRFARVRGRKAIGLACNRRRPAFACQVGLEHEQL